MKIYVILALVIILAVALFVLSFVYLEKTVHRNYYYVIKINNTPRGFLEIDSYTTLTNNIYKSRQTMVYELGLPNRDIKLTLDKDTKSLKEFELVKSDRKTKELYYLKNSPKGLMFLSIAQSKFSCLTSLSIKQTALPYNRRDISTWIPFVRNYDYRIGGAQSFKALRYNSSPLPPYRGNITLTSIRDEFINVDNVKIKTECLILKEKGKGQIFIWVNKNSHNIVAIDIPEENKYILLTKRRTPLPVVEYTPKGNKYTQKRISFSSKGTELRGILRKPMEKNGAYPAIILIQSENARGNMQYSILSDMANHLSNNGYVTLMYNPSGSNGNAKFQSLSISDEWLALESAINFIEEYRFVDIDRIGIVVHSDANSLIPKFLEKEPRIKSWVMLSPTRLVSITGSDTEYTKAMIREISGFDPIYKKNVFDTIDKTLEITEESSSDRKRIIGKKVFLLRIKEIMRLNSVADMKAVSIPILVIQGKIDKSYSSGFMQSLEAAIKDPGFTNRSIISFRKLDGKLGSIIEHESIRDHYKADSEVLETVTTWLDKNLPQEETTSNMNSVSWGNKNFVKKW